MISVSGRGLKLAVKLRPLNRLLRVSLFPVVSKVVSTVL